MASAKNSVGRSLIKKRFPNQRRAATTEEWVSRQNRNWNVLPCYGKGASKTWLYRKHGLESTQSTFGHWSKFFRWIFDYRSIGWHWLCCRYVVWRASIRNSFFLIIIERLNVTFIPAVAKVGILTAEDKERIRQAQDLHKDRLHIPRR